MNCHVFMEERLATFLTKRPHVLNTYRCPRKTSLDFHWLSSALLRPCWSLTTSTRHHLPFTGHFALSTHLPICSISICRTSISWEPHRNYWYASRITK